MMAPGPEWMGWWLVEVDRNGHVAARAVRAPTAQAAAEHAWRRMGWPGRVEVRQLGWDGDVWRAGPVVWSND